MGCWFEDWIVTRPVQGSSWESRASSFPPQPSDWQACKSQTVKLESDLFCTSLNLKFSNFWKIWHTFAERMPFCQSLCSLGRKGRSSPSPSYWLQLCWWQKSEMEFLAHWRWLRCCCWKLWVCCCCCNGWPDCCCCRRWLWLVQQRGMPQANWRSLGWCSQRTGKAVNPQPIIWFWLTSCFTTSARYQHEIQHEQCQRSKRR